jgi:hypothetical protein
MEMRRITLWRLASVTAWLIALGRYARIRNLPSTVVAAVPMMRRALHVKCRKFFSCGLPLIRKGIS